MKSYRFAAAALILLAASVTGAVAQPRDDRRPDGGRPPIEDHHDDRGGGERRDWRRGDHMPHEDWDRAGRVDYRDHHLRQPPRGYEWREVNGQYILGAIATGVIADIFLNAR